MWFFVNDICDYCTHPFVEAFFAEERMLGVLDKGFCCTLALLNIQISILLMVAFSSRSAILFLIIVIAITLFSEYAIICFRV